MSRRHKHRLRSKTVLQLYTSGPLHALRCQLSIWFLVTCPLYDRVPQYTSRPSRPSHPNHSRPPRVFQFPAGGPRNFQEFRQISTDQPGRVTAIAFFFTSFGMHRRALIKGSVVRRILANTRPTQSSRLIPQVQLVARQQQSVWKQSIRYSSGMSALNEAQNPQVGEGTEGAVGGKAVVIDGNAIAR